MNDGNDDEFDAGPFSDLAETGLGKALWRFLNTASAVADLKTATFQGYPALAGVQDALLERFGDDVRAHGIKRMLGRMVRRVMEMHGYRFVRSGVWLPAGGLFSRASCYHDKRWRRR